MLFKLIFVFRQFFSEKSRMKVLVLLYLFYSALNNDGVAGNVESLDSDDTNSGASNSNSIEGGINSEELLSGLPGRIGQWVLELVFT